MLCCAVLCCAVLCCAAVLLGFQHVKNRFIVLLHSTSDECGRKQVRHQASILKVKAVLMQGVMPFYGNLASLRLHMPAAAAASASQDMSDTAQVNSRSLSDPLASITSRINRGSLEDRPSSSSAGPALGAGQGPTGQFGAALEQEFWQGPSAALPDDPFNLFGDIVIPGMPILGPGSEPIRPGMLRQEQQAGQLSSSLPTRRSAPSQRDTMPELQAQQTPHRSLSLQAPFPLARQGPTLDPQRQQLRQQQFQQQFQQQPQFGLPTGFQTSLNSMGFMSSGQVPQLQAFPASPGLARVASLDTSSSQIGGRASHRSGSLRSDPRSPTQTSGQFAFSSEAAHPSQQGQGQGQGQGLPVMPFRHATSLSPGAVGPLGRAPSHSPSQIRSPHGVLGSGQLLQQAYCPPSLWYPEGSSQGHLRGPNQEVAGPLFTHQPEGSPSYQPAAGQGWGQSGVLPMLGAHPGSQRTTSGGSEPGVWPLLPG